MTVKLLFITMAAYIKVVSSQYYSPPAPGFYHHNYYPSVLTSPVPPTFAPLAIPALMPPMFAPPFLVPTFSTRTKQTTVPNYVPTFVPPQVPAYPPIYRPYVSAPPPTYMSIPTISPAPKYPSAVSPTPKYVSPAAVAYYMTEPHETSKKVATEKAKEIAKEKSPTYPCPFCTGFANVPKNLKVPPPPPCLSVLPGVLDKIPTIKVADELKIKELSKFAKPMPLLADLFEDKLSGKLRFDEDVLDGFLIGLGLGKCKD